MSIIEARDLYKQYEVQEREAGLAKAMLALFSRKTKKVVALKAMSFDIEEGEFIGMIGPNGAGKSTTIKILTGVLVPSGGKATVMDVVPYEKREQNAKNIGVVFGQKTNLWWDLPVSDSFELIRDIYEIPDDKYKANVKMFARLLDIDKYMQTPVRKLSLGERMRCELAASLLHDPRIVFLDEPTIGLDVVAKERTRKFLKEINRKKGVTIILTTHDMGDIEELCERIVIIDKGTKLFDGPIGDIVRRFGKIRTVALDLHEKGRHMGFHSLSGRGVKLLDHHDSGARFAIDTDKVSVSDFVKKALSRLQVKDFRIEEPDIEEIIRHIYTKGMQ